RRRRDRSRPRAGRALRHDAHFVRPQAPGAGRQPARGRARRPRPETRDPHGVHVQRRPGRRRGGHRDPRHPRLRPRRLQPRLRRRGDPVRLPRAAERARGRPIHPLLLRALDRWRLRRAELRAPGRLPARHRRADAALHGLHRVSRPAARNRAQLHHAGPASRIAPQEAEMIALPVASIFTQAFLTSLVAGGLLAGVPLMFTALGEQISEASGVLNIGLEGMMLTGAYTGFVGAYYGGHDWLGYLAAIAGGMAVSVIMVLFCVRLLLDQIVVGIAITLGAEGATSVLQGAQFGQSYPRLPAASDVSIPLLDRIPIFGASLFQQPLVVYLGFALIAFTAWMLR